MSDKVYLNGIKVKKAEKQWFQLDLSLCYEDIITWMKENKDHAKESKGGKHFFNCELKERKSVGQFGETHLIELNTWKPPQQSAGCPETKEEDKPLLEMGTEVPTVDNEEDIPF